MTIREATFGDLFKFGFWVQMAPMILIVILIALICSLVFAISPAFVNEVANQYAEKGQSVNWTGGNAILSVLLVWLFALIYLIVSAIGVAFSAVIGSALVYLWRAIFMKSPPPAPAA